MKRFTLRQAIIYGCICIVLSVGLGGWIRGKQWHRPFVDALRNIFSPTPASPIQDFSKYLLDNKDLYSGISERELQEKRLSDQAKLLEEYEKDPTAFIKKYEINNGTFLLDAVVDGKNLFRVGRIGDGGKWLSDPTSLKSGSVVYSFGVGSDISFDVQMAGLFGCEVHMFDPGPSVEKSFANYHPGQAIGKGNFWYHAVGLGPTSAKPDEADNLIIEGRKCPVKRLSEFAAELGHTHVDVLKIDIEGGEMPALLEMISSQTLEKLAVKQLCVEFHLWDEAQYRDFVHIIGLLRERGYLIFRKEFNPQNMRCAEFAFIATE
jgi:FkbM family methyltransferase